MRQLSAQFDLNAGEREFRRTVPTQPKNIFSKITAID
jgi:hypothetical protein